MSGHFYYPESSERQAPSELDTLKRLLCYCHTTDASGQPNDPDVTFKDGAESSRDADNDAYDSGDDLGSDIELDRYEESLVPKYGFPGGRPIS